MLKSVVIFQQHQIFHTYLQEKKSEKEWKAQSLLAKKNAKKHGDNNLAKEGAKHRVRYLTSVLKFR